MIRRLTIIFLTLSHSLFASENNKTALDPAIEAHYRREKVSKSLGTLKEVDIKNLELSLDDDIDQYSKFKGTPKEFKKKKNDVIKYRSKKIIKKGARLYIDGNYYITPRSFVALISHNPKEFSSQILNIFDEETYYVRNIDLIPTKRFFDINVKPDSKISYPKKLLNKKYYDKLPMLFKADLQTEIFKEGYLDELSDNSSVDSQVPSIAAGLGISLHLVTNYDFILNFGLSSFLHAGTWISGFEKTLYQSLFLGPEVILKVGSIEGLNIYGICELTRSLYNNISDTEKTIDLFLRNTSIKFAVELKSKQQKSTWYTGAYYRLIESSLGRETPDNVSKPRFRQNSNAYGLYFGRTFDFYW